MRKLLLVGILCLAAGWFIRAQTGSVMYFAPASGTTVTNCGTPASGFPLCGVATGWFVWNGTTWTQWGSAGVTSVTANGVKQVGDVVLPPIPSKVTITSTGVMQ